MSNYKHKKQPRLVQSHWDLEDEFINLSMPSTETSTNYQLIQALGQSSSKHHHLLLLVLFAYISIAIVLTIKRVMATKVDKKRPIVTTRVKRRESPKRRQSPCAATVSSPSKRARRVGTTKRRKKFRASNLMKEKFSDGESSFFSEPTLVEETKQADVKKTNVPPEKTSTVQETTKQVCSEKVDVKKTSAPAKKTVRDGGALIRTSTSQGPRMFESQVSSMSIHEESETMELAQKIMRSADVLKEQGLDEEDAKKLATQLELGKKQLADEQKHQNQRMMAEMKVRSIELQRTEARHQETVKAQRVDRDWVRKCIEARDKLLTYSTRAFLYLLFAMLLDQLLKTGLDTLRSALVSLTRLNEPRRAQHNPVPHLTLLFPPPFSNASVNLTLSGGHWGRGAISSTPLVRILRTTQPQYPVG